MSDKVTVKFKIRADDYETEIGDGAIHASKKLHN
jgi:hypothetical protein